MGLWQHWGTNMKSHRSAAFSDSNTAAPWTYFSIELPLYELYVWDSRNQPASVELDVAWASLTRAEGQASAWPTSSSSSVSLPRCTEQKTVNHLP